MLLGFKYTVDIIWCDAIALPFCPECGIETSEDSRLCPSCRHVLTQLTHRQEPIKQRPTEVSILAVLQVLGGLASFVLGVITLALIGSLPPPPQDVSALLIFGVVVVRIIGGIMSVFGVLGFVIAFGYWNGRGWAWTLGMVITAMGLILSLLTIPQSIISLIMNGLIIYYLTRPYVKRWFGKNQ